MEGFRNYSKMLTSCVVVQTCTMYFDPKLSSLGTESGSLRKRYPDHEPPNQNLGIMYVQKTHQVRSMLPLPLVQVVQYANL